MVGFTETGHHAAGIIMVDRESDSCDVKNFPIHELNHGPIIQSPGCIPLDHLRHCQSGIKYCVQPDVRFFPVCNGHGMREERTPPPLLGGRGGVWVVGWVGQLGWVGGLPSPEAALLNMSSEPPVAASWCVIHPAESPRQQRGQKHGQTAGETVYNALRSKDRQ